MARNTTKQKAIVKQPMKKRDNCKRKLRRQQLIKYLRSELRMSSTHGLQFIVDEKLHWFDRIFWATSFTISATIAVYLLSRQYARFIETPTVMSVETDYYNWNVSYPAYTLCPTLKYDTDSFAKLINDTKAKTGEDLEPYLNTVVSAGLDNLELLDLPTRDDPLQLIDPKDYANLAAMTFIKFNEESLTTNTDVPISWHAVMTELGMCHVVNSNVGDLDDPFKWSFDTPPNYDKRSIDISVYERDFFSQIVNYAEVYKVFIHSPDEIALSTTPSYTHSLRGFVTFGTQVSSIKISDSLRKFPLNVRKCRFHNESTSKRYPIYSYNRCLMECRIQLILKLCGCIPHFYKPLPHEKVCTLVELNCVVSFKKDIVALAVSDITQLQFRQYQGLPRSSRDCGCLSNCETEVYRKDYEVFKAQDSFNTIRIGISTFPKFRVVKDFIFSFADIILKSGGVINLCIGASILSMAEMFVVIIRIHIYYFYQIWENVKKRYFRKFK